MTDNEKLRKDAARAITWEERGTEEPNVDWPVDMDEAERIVDVVLAVFEKAHTPTDDEHLDIISAASAAFKARGGAPDWEEDAIARDLIIRWHLRGFEDGLAAGFRRSEVQESTRQIRECTVCGERVTMSNATEAWEKRHGHRGPQGEPSDAQVLAALNAYHYDVEVDVMLGDWSNHKQVNMRAALRAAGGVR